MINFKEIRLRTDLLALVNTDLKKVSGTGGGEWAGPCPLCAGTDRFHVQPNNKNGGAWFCRNCTDGKWRDATDFVALRDNVGKGEAARRLCNGRLRTATDQKRYVAPPAAPKVAPDFNWQSKAMAVISECEKLLWSPAGDTARQWLHDTKGLTDETICNFRLGLCPSGYDSGRWISKQWVWGGIVIPWLIGGKVWKLQIRRIWGAISEVDEAGKDRQKYGQIGGGAAKALFGYDDLRGKKKAIIVEGELDSMFTWQELQGTGIAVISIGSKDNAGIDMATWALDFLPLTDLGILMDCDGKSDKAAKQLLALTKRAFRIVVPDGMGKDPTTFRQAGGDIKRWLSNEMGMASIVVTWPSDAKVALPKRVKTLPDGRIEAHYRSRLELAQAMLPTLAGDERDEIIGEIYCEYVRMGINDQSIFN